MTVNDAEHHMIRHVVAPTPEQFTAASAVIRAHLAPSELRPLGRVGPGILAKLEQFQPTGSFKIRGALAAVAAAMEHNRNVRIVTASAGNHGLGVATAADLLGAHATVCVPQNASSAKVAKLRATGADLVLVGSSFPEAESYALEFATTHGATFISPYNDPTVIAGQATIVDEILEDVDDLARVIVPVGGGGLASGIALALAGSGVEVVGVQPSANAAMAAALRDGCIGHFSGSHTVADGLAGGLEPGSVTVEILAQHLTQILTVDEDAIAAAVAQVFINDGLVLEGSGAVGVAALHASELEPIAGTTVVLLTGRNVAPELFAELLVHGAQRQQL